MPVTRQKSVALSRTLQNVGDASSDVARIGMLEIDFTQVGAGDIASIAELNETVGGRVKILGHISRIVTSAFGASRTLSIGFDAGKNRDGSDRAAAPANIKSAADVSGAGALTGLLNPVVETRDRGLIIATVAGGTIPDGATIKGELFYVAL